MGASSAAECLNTITTILVGDLQQDELMHKTIHIDNGLLLGPPKTLVKAINKIRRRAEDWNITIGDLVHQPTQTIVFYGLLFDLQQKTITLQQKQIDKLTQLCQVVQKHTINVKTVFAVIGYLMYLSRCLWNCQIVRPPKKKKNIGELLPVPSTTTEISKRLSNAKLRTDHRNSTV